mgnify:CR=1 FL=1
MKRLLIVLLLLSFGCASRRAVVPAGASASVAGGLIEDTTTALSTDFADLDKILKSDLKSEDKVKLISELMEKRSVLMDKLLARKEKQASNVIQVLHNVGIFVTAIIGAKVF